MTVGSSIPAVSISCCLVEAPEGTKVPRRVELNYALDGGADRPHGNGQEPRARSSATRFPPCSTAFRCGLPAETYVSRTPLRVEVVEPPRLDQVTLDCDYPDYTGLDRDSQGAVTPHTVEVQGSQVALPMETAFVFHARANKPLVGLRIESETRRISLFRDRATIAVRFPSGDVGPEQRLPAPALRSVSIGGRTASGDPVPDDSQGRSQKDRGEHRRPGRLEKPIEDVARSRTSADRDPRRLPHAD